MSCWEDSGLIGWEGGQQTLNLDPKSWKDFKIVVFNIVLCCFLYLHYDTRQVFLCLVWFCSGTLPRVFMSHMAASRDHS